MKVESVQVYKLRVKNDLSYKLKEEGVLCSFSKPATIRGIAKLYTVSQNNILLYVGIASQPISSRLNGGLKAKGKNGYHGYKWKHIRCSLVFRVWTVKEKGSYIDLSEMEAIEAEVAYLYRKNSNQWPKYQNEIHFQQSKSKHRKIAESIYLGVIA